MRFLLSLAWRDLRGGSRSLWLFGLCLVLGVTLIAATGTLYRQVSGALLADARSLFGGDLEVESRTALPPELISWMNSTGEVSLLIELRTMLGIGDGRFRLVELQSVDEAYPLYGELELDPPQGLADATAQRDGLFGAALDPVLAGRFGIRLGDTVEIGSLTMQVRALIRRQPDRSLSADWRGPPVLIAAPALFASSLIQPGSRLEYEYRLRTAEDPMAWRDEFNRRFPVGDWEIQTFDARSERMAEVLNQIASGLLLIGFSALFIGGLGVFNSIEAYLQGKLATIATFRTLGMRDARLSAVYILQVAILSGGASLVGVLLGGVLALAGHAVVAQRLPLEAAPGGAPPALLLAALFGMLTAFTFALPAIGRALSVDPAALFRGLKGALTDTPKRYKIATALMAVLLAATALAALPEPLFGLAFMAALAVVIGLLELLVRALRRVSHGLERLPQLDRRFALRLALANMHRRGSPLRATLLSLGSALTLLVACALVVTALLRAINDTLPDQAPALVFYDISDAQRDTLRKTLSEFDSFQRLELAPLVLGRLHSVNGKRLRDSGDPERVNEGYDEHKLSDQGNNIDGVRVVQGEWWGADHDDPPQVAMEDREAEQLGLRVGDRLQFQIFGELLEADLAAIYSQRGIQTRFWFEAMFSDGVLDPYISRYVGAAWMDDEQALSAQDQIGALAPNVVIVRTQSILAEARSLLAKASAGLGVVVAISFVASLLVLGSAIATGRARQVYEATLLHSLGTRLAVIRASLQLEFVLLAAVTSLFAIAGGAALALPLLVYRIKLPVDDLMVAGVATAVLVSTVALSLGGRYLMRAMRVNPAALLRSGG